MKLPCKEYAQEILDAVKRVPNKKKLLIITVGDDKASMSYVNGKKKDCDYCNIPYIHLRFNETEQPNVAQTIQMANKDDSIGGIIVQLPLPEGWDENYITGLVSPEKDVDGFVHGSKFKPCTPEAIIWLMRREFDWDLKGKTVLLIGRGKLVGRPLIDMLLKENCTITICHSKTERIRDYLEDYHDIVITAVGKKLFNVDMAYTRLLIDAGITFDNGKIGGDCYGFTDGQYDYVTTPGGIGLLTRAMLMRHME